MTTRNYTLPKYSLSRDVVTSSYYQVYKNSGKPLSQNPPNLRQFYGPIENQGAEGACSAFAALQWRGALRRQAGLSWINPSYQAQYYEERARRGTINQDSGASLEDAIVVLEQFGVMPAEDDPYTQSDFAVEPPAKDWIFSQITQAALKEYLGVDRP